MARFAFFTRSLLAARAAVGGPAFCVEIRDRIYERDVGESLGKISDEALSPHMVFLCEQPDVIAKLQ